MFLTTVLLLNSIHIILRGGGGGYHLKITLYFPSFRFIKLYLHY